MGEITPAVNLSVHLIDEAVRMNDGGFKFTQIADFLEKEWDREEGVTND